MQVQHARSRGSCIRQVEPQRARGAQGGVGLGGCGERKRPKAALASFYASDRRWNAQPPPRVSHTLPSSRTRQEFSPGTVASKRASERRPVRPRRLAVRHKRSLFSRGVACRRASQTLCQITSNVSRSHQCGRMEGRTEGREGQRSLNVRLTKRSESILR